jgi:hypothetical protein
MKNFSAYLNRHQGLLALLALVASVLIAIAPGLSSDWMKLPEQQRNINTVVIFGACVLVLSVVIDSWYVHTWGWLGGLRFSTAAGRAALVQSGRNEVEERVAAERRAAQRPVWRLQRRKDWGDEEDIFILYNRGAAVASNVQVKSLDSDEFVVSNPTPLKSTFYEDPMGDTGRQVVGYLGDKSMETGVHVCVSWVDLNGDPQEDRDVFISPEELKRAN